MQCRFCNTVLKHVFIDLGNTPISNAFLNRENIEAEEEFFPLKLFVCHSCFLVQVGEVRNASEIFNNRYIYYSSFSRSWLEHSQKYVLKMIDCFKLNGQSHVVEIASNDGYLLQYFKEKNIPSLGIEPTANTAKVAIDKGINTEICFFGKETATGLSNKNKNADLLIGNNVLAHVPDINDFVSGLKILLKPGGIITMEFPHLVRLIEMNQFDTIYHEHFSYLSCTSVSAIFNHHGLELFDVEEIPTHGGSLRIYAKHIENSAIEVSPNVTDLLKSEENNGIRNLNYYYTLQTAAEKIREDFINFLNTCKRQNKRVCAYGAAAKGNTLLNYCGVKDDIIKFVVDASPYKQGLFLPGSKIPVINEKHIKEFKPDYIIILPWNIKDEICNQLSYVRDWNCQFVVAIPNVEIF